MKINRNAATILLVLVALFGGMYLGANGNHVSGQALGARVIPEDIESDADFSGFWEAWRLIEDRHPDGVKVTAQEKVWAATAGLVDSLDDPYSAFLPPEDTENLNIDLRGEFSGVGMEVGLKDDVLTVVAPLKDSPAEKSGIMAGDKILKIDDTITSGMTVDAAVKLIRGEANTSVVITIARDGLSESKEITVTRQVIKLPTIETKYFKDDKIFLISFFNFGENANVEFEKALGELKESGATKLIIDLRNNPGGYLSAAVETSSWFLKAGDVVVNETSKNEADNIVYKARGRYLPVKYDIVILVNEGSASASEIMAGALQEHGVATIVGTKTFGKGSVQELIQMDNKTSLKLTIAEWQTPNGVSISKQGLTPDILVELDAEKLEKGIDTQLEEAKSILKK